MRIITNNCKRDVISGWQLTDNEAEQFDYYKDRDALSSASFFRYKGYTYDLGEFTTVGELEQFKGWHGYLSDSFFSGIVIKWVDNSCEEVIVGTYLA